MINEKTMFHGYEFVKGISFDHGLDDEERKELTLAIFAAMNNTLNVLEQSKMERLEQNNKRIVHER